MSEIGVAGGCATWRDTPSDGGHALDARRVPQLASAKTAMGKGVRSC
jgi:hypothetical protein